MSENREEDLQFSHEQPLQQSIKEVADHLDTKKNLPAAFKESKFLQFLGEQKDRGIPPTALFTDIDNTFYKKGYENEQQEVMQMAERYSVPIVAVTGNDFAGVLRRIESGELPYFAAIAGSVGTEILALHQDAAGKKFYIKDDSYEHMLLEKGYERTHVAQQTLCVIQEARTAHAAWKLDFQKPEAERWFQEGKTSMQIDGQTQIPQPFKVSCYAFARSLEELKDIQQQFILQFPGQKILVCEEINHNSKLEEGDTKKKYCIDILPVSKGDAVEYISTLAALDVSIVAGDSGNDVDQLLGSGTLGIEVGKAKPELTAQIDAIVQEQNSSGRYFKKIEVDGHKRRIFREYKPERQGPGSILAVGKMLELVLTRSQLKEAA